MFCKPVSLMKNAAQRRRILMLGAVVALLLSTVVPVSLTQSSRTITTIAGTGLCGYSGDGNTATFAQLNRQAGLCTDLAGNVYIVDLANHVVRKISTFGVITTVAGTGAPGYNGDGKVATNSQLAAPTAAAVDASGRNLYIVDNGNHRIRRVDLLNGTMTTFAGGGNPADGLGDGKLATEAKLISPSAIAMDALGNVFVGDFGHFRVRRVDITTGIMTTVAGSGARGYCGDNGPALSACFKGIVALAFGPTGELYIADADDKRVRKVSNGVVTTFAGNGTYTLPTPGPATQSSIKRPQGVAVDVDGSVYIADNVNHQVYRVSPTGVLSILVGTGTPGFAGDNGPAENAMLNGPSGLAVDRFRNLYISDTLNCRVRRVGP
jgi:sugar lactone lactonase YvrE